nr:calcium-translocating P-type ATPase, PMCA-type [Maliibacterium massiliense]
MNAKKLPRPGMRRGLTPEAVAQSRKTYGSNTLTQKKRSTFARQFLANFGDPIIKVLLGALVLNLLFMFQNANWFETAGIALAIFLATFVSTLSEYGSESAFIKLQQEAASAVCRVERAEGVEAIKVEDVVVGDLVHLQAGERVPADGILLEGTLSLDQSALNGESKEAKKTPGAGDDAHWDFLSRDQLFRGSIVCGGEGVMLVSRVGDATFYGDMAREMQEETRESPLKVRLNHLAGILSKLGYCAAGIVAVADLFNAFILDNQMNWALIASQLTNPGVVFANLLHALTLAITVVVVAVPEGLPMMITVVLSSNMSRMLKDNVLVRKLVGIETSGSLNILFTDKTGTLTEGKLSVEQIVDGTGKVYQDIADFRSAPRLWHMVQLSCLYNTQSVISRGEALGGNATDRAMLQCALPDAHTLGDYRRRASVPFDSARKFSAVELEGGRSRMVLIKGAPEKILPFCAYAYDAGGERYPLTGRSEVSAQWQRMASGAMRVLALATSDTRVTEAGRFGKLTLIGLVGIRDALRPEVPGAIEQVTGAGVQVVMITGDNRDTAAAIARDAGLLRRQSDLVITSDDLAGMSDDHVKKILRDLRVVARALPTDKSRLVRLAQEMGLVAGMTGDGINDAPALKRADVGFAMGSGTEVAKEAGDIVILDDNFASIARAILYGRTIFKSIRKFIIFQLTMNFCAVAISIIGPFIGVDTPVTVVQMLWINIIMDTLAGLAFAGEPPLPQYMQEKPKRRSEPVFNKYMLNQIVWMGTFTVLLLIAFLKLPGLQHVFHFNQDPVYFMTAFFALFVFAGVFNGFNARTTRINPMAHLRENPMFILIMIAVCAVQILLIYFGGTLFRTAGLALHELLAVLLLSLLVIPVDMLRKFFLRIIGIKGNI